MIKIKIGSNEEYRVVELTGDETLQSLYTYSAAGQKLEGGDFQLYIELPDDIVALI